MTWERFVLVTEKQDINEIKQISSTLKFKCLSENKGYLLIICEGRYVIDIDLNQSMIISIDDEDNNSYKGNLSLASYFNIQLKVLVGFSIYISDHINLKKHKKGLKLLDFINYIDSSDSEIEENILYTRIEINGLENNIKILKALNDLSEICTELGYVHRISIYSDGHGNILGDLDDLGLWIGPSSYIYASWESNQNEIIINSSEILINDNTFLFD